MEYHLSGCNTTLSSGTFDVNVWETFGINPETLLIIGEYKESHQV